MQTEGKHFKDFCCFEKNNKIKWTPETDGPMNLQLLEHEGLTPMTFSL